MSKNMKTLFLDRERCERFIFYTMDIAKHCTKFNSHHVAKQVRSPLMFYTAIHNIEYEDDIGWNVRIDFTIVNNIKLSHCLSMSKLQIYSYFDGMLQNNKLCNVSLTSSNHINISNSNVSIYITLIPVLDDNFTIVLRDMKKQKKQTIPKANYKPIYILFVHDITALMINKEALINIFKQDNIHIITLERVFPCEYNVFSLLNSAMNNKRTYFEILYENNKKLAIENRVLKEELKRIKR